MYVSTPCPVHLRFATSVLHLWQKMLKKKQMNNYLHHTTSVTTTWYTYIKKQVKHVRAFWYISSTQVALLEDVKESYKPPRDDQTLDSIYDYLRPRCSITNKQHCVYSRLFVLCPGSVLIYYYRTILSEIWKLFSQMMYEFIPSGQTQGVHKWDDIWFERTRDAGDVSGAAQIYCLFIFFLIAY